MKTFKKKNKIKKERKEKRENQANQIIYDRGHENTARQPRNLISRNETVSKKKNTKQRESLYAALLNEQKETS